MYDAIIIIVYDAIIIICVRCDHHHSPADASHTDASHADASHTDASHTDASHADASHTNEIRVFEPLSYGDTQYYSVQ